MVTPSTEWTARSIDRALRAGVRGIEHGNLLDDGSIALLRERDAFLTMNLLTYHYLKLEGRKYGLSEDNWKKVDAVLAGGIEALEKAHRGGVNLCYGTDLLGGMQRHQAQEFAIRAEVVPTLDTIRSATTTAARLLQREGELGVVAPGAHGDLVVLDRDPLEDVSARSEGRPAKVVQGGEVKVDRTR